MRSSYHFHVGHVDSATFTLEYKRAIALVVHNGFGGEFTDPAIGLVNGQEIHQRAGLDANGNRSTHVRFVTSR
jgi:hypothetical protein